MLLAEELIVENEKKSLFYCEKVEITKEEAVNICKQTTNLKNDAWKNARKLRLTGSICYEIYTYLSNKNPNWKQKVDKVLFNSFTGNADTRHGVRSEPKAKKKYESQCETTITNIGIVIREEVPWLGYSPDGVIVRNSTLKFLIEIKCPIIGKKLTAAEVARTMNCFIVDEYDQFIFKTNHKYFAQIQLGMFLLNLPKCHFIVYASFDNSIKIFEVDYDEMYAHSLIVSLKNAYFNFILPQITLRMQEPKENDEL